jgi:hypothetical protein
MFGTSHLAVMPHLLQVSLPVQLIAGQQEQ